MLSREKGTRESFGSLPGYITSMYGNITMKTNVN
jgi:hypothetical protein